MMPLTVPIGRFASVLPTLEVLVGGTTGTWLLDTGAGLTCLDAATARSEGIEGWGQLVGHRMTGERVDLLRADDVTIEIGGVRFPHETVAIVDLQALLPPEMGALAGAVSLATFADQPITLDLPRSTLVLETPASLAERTAAADAIQVRCARAVGGLSLDLFVEIESRRGLLRFEIDSGCTGASILSPHAAAALGLDNCIPGATAEVVLPLRGAPPLVTRCVVKEIVYDGVLGLSVLENRALTLDLAWCRAWLARP